MRTFVFVALLTTCVACGGSSASSTATEPAPTVPPGPAPGPIPDPGPAPVTSTLASLDAPCAGNASLTARPIVAALRSAPYTGVYAAEGTTTSSALSLAVKYAGGVIRCNPGYSGNTGGAPDRPASVDVDLEITLTTDDGTFADTLVAAAELRGAEVSLLTQPLNPGGLKGTFAPTPMPGFDLLTVMISGQLAANGTTTGNVQQIGSKSGTPSPGTVNPSRTQSAGRWK